MNNDLNEIIIFSKVAQLCSFTQAAEALGIEKSTASNKVSQLEARLGVKLLQRTTRKVNVTQVGRQYLGYCLEALDQLKQADLAVKDLNAMAKGHLKVAMPPNLLEVIMETVLIPFMQTYPLVNLELVQTDRAIDMIQEQFDIAIQPGPELIDDTSFIYRKLFTTHWSLVATTEFLKNAGVTAQSSSDMIEQLPFIKLDDYYKSIHNSNAQIQPAHCFHNGRKLQFKPRLTINNSVEAIKAMKAGVGMSILPKAMVREGLQSGLYKECLPDVDIHNTSLYIIYPSRTGQTANVRYFVDAIIGWGESRQK